MTVLLVIATFAVFIVLDFLLTRRLAGVHGTVAPSTQPPPTMSEPVWVAGFQVPDGLHYHRGHTWARTDDDGDVTIGVDDFARRLLGSAREVHLPAVGTWLVQGEPGPRVTVDGRSAALLAPIEGEVLAHNSELGTRPQLATDDPYGRGWLLRVRPTNLGANLSNLLSGTLARRFMQDAREALDLRLMALSGSVLQDGGEPHADFALELPQAEWKRLVREFLLT